MSSITYTYFRPGHPRSNSGGQIAFYQPFLDRFLLVVPQEVEVVTKISMLANLRYPILPLYISNAPGYNHTLLDNGCCEGWTTILENQHRKKIYDNDRATHVIHHNQYLKPAAALPDEYHVFSLAIEKQWMQLLWFWQEFLHFIEQEENPYQPVIQFVNDYLLPEQINPRYRLQLAAAEREINHILSVEIDPDRADQTIRDYIAKKCIFLQDVLEWFMTHHISNQS